jgi:uncharacterized protein GlcG (DUF336 family)
MPRATRLDLEQLERRDAAAVVAALVGSSLDVTGTSGRDNIGIDRVGNEYVVRDRDTIVGRFDATLVTQINVDGGPENDVIRVGRDITIPVLLVGGGGNDKLIGGAGPQVLVGGSGNDRLVAGSGPAVLDSGTGRDQVIGVKPGDVVAPNPQAVVQNQGTFSPAVLQSLTPAIVAPQVITTSDVQSLLQRASGATSSDDAIIAIVDRNGRILGVRVEGGVAPQITSDPNLLTFAIDGAVAEARTGAFFANNQAPLTSRTVQFISQSTITQREVESLPFDQNPNSSGRGPGYVAPVGSGGHFPPNVPDTPQVDLFGIEHSNRDSLDNPGPDHIKGTADDIILPDRFNIDPAFVPAGVELFAPESYGEAFGQRQAQSRGIGTLPGGIPLYKNGELVGGIGVFFPGKTGFATEENSSLSTTYDPSKPDRTLEAEYMAFVAAGGAPGIGFPAPTVAGIAPVQGYALPLTPDNQRIDLVGVTLDIIGPGGLNGPSNLMKYAQTLQPGNPFSGTDVPVAPGVMYQQGKPVAEGYLVTPHDGVGITAAQVQQIIQQGIDQANQTRAAIRLPLDSRTKMVFAVTDSTGAVLGLYRMPDATVFSIDIAVAKARNAAYYANPTLLQPIDQLPGEPRGTAFTARTFRYLAEPRFPEGIDSKPPGPFSIYNDGGANPANGLINGPRLPASAFQSAYGYDSFNPSTNFHDPLNPANQNGVVFFPGSAPLYTNGRLVGGVGVSGDGVDQDDVVTAFADAGFKTPTGVLKADDTFFNGIRLPYQKFNRNPGD